MAISFGPGISITGGGNFSAGQVIGNPVVTAVVVSGTTATISFTAPALNGHPAPLYYVATSTPGNLTGTSVTSPITVAGLSTGTSYTFAVTPVNVFGAGQTVSQNYVVSVSTSSVLYTWGSNNVGQLGFFNTTNYSSPKQVGSLATWNTVFAGAAFTIALKNDGTLWTWGMNLYGQLGQGNTNNYSSPQQVGALTNWSTIAAGRFNSLAIKKNGTLWAWGRNTWGQLGQGGTASYSSPGQVGSLTNWLAISNGGYHSVAIKTDGSLWAWGDNQFGALGQSNTTNIFSPVQVGALTNWLGVVAGYFATLAIKTDGTLWAWGGNEFGDLGVGNTNYYSSPRQVGTLSNWSKISILHHHTVAVKNDGTLWMWGQNNYGQLGLGGSGSYITSPRQVGALTNWSNVSVGTYDSFAIKTDGTLWSWGQNNYGQLGLGTTTNISSPTQIGLLTNWLSMASGDYHSTAIFNTVIGLSAPLAPTAVTATATGSTTANITYTAPATGSGATSFTAVSTPGGITGTTSTSGSGTISVSGLSPLTAYTFRVYGSNSAGAGLWSAASTSTTTGKPTGTLWAWGYNVDGNLGLNNTNDYSSPVQINSQAVWTSVSSLNKGSGTKSGAAVKSDGTLWTWGASNHSQLGRPGITSSISQVGSLTNWSTVSCGVQHMIAIKTDGTLWAWGYNASGQLGLGNTTQYGSPQQVGALTNWLSVAASGYVSSAVKSDGTLWMWGESGNGQLGLGEGSNHNHSSPTQVGTLTNWAAVSPSGGYHTLAVKTDGTLWSWGDNDKGQLGLGNSTYYSSPKQIGNLTTWQLPMTAGFCHSSFAIRTDGTLWSWGQGSYGILGLGSTANINSPRQVGALTNWSTVAAGYGHAMAIKTNGTLWGWGFPLRGDIGVGNTNYYSSPVQVGALSTWLTVAAGYGWTLATHS